MIIKKKLAATTAAGLATLMVTQSVHAQEPTSTSKSLDEYEAQMKEYQEKKAKYEAEQAKNTNKI